MLQESKIKGCADGILNALLEDHMSAIIARANGIKDIWGIIIPIAVTLHIAHSRPKGVRWHWSMRFLWKTWNRRAWRDMIRSRWALPFLVKPFEFSRPRGDSKAGGKDRQQCCELESHLFNMYLIWQLWVLSHAGEKFPREMRPFLSSILHSADALEGSMPLPHVRRSGYFSGDDAFECTICEAWYVDSRVPAVYTVIAKL